MKCPACDHALALHMRNKHQDWPSHERPYCTCGCGVTREEIREHHNKNPSPKILLGGGVIGNIGRPPKPIDEKLQQDLYQRWFKVRESLGAVGDSQMLENVRTWLSYYPEQGKHLVEFLEDIHGLNKE